MVTDAMCLSHLEVQDISTRDLDLKVLKRFRKVIKYNSKTTIGKKKKHSASKNSIERALKYKRGKVFSTRKVFSQGQLQSEFGICTVCFN